MINKYKSDTTFEKAYQADIEKYRKFLVQYLDVYDDGYYKEIFRKIIRQQRLTELERSRVKELVQKVDLDLMLVNSMIGVPPKKDGISKRIEVIMKVGKDKLEKWDYRFIFGDSGEALLVQYIARNYLSDKQTIQLERIEYKLGLKR